MVALRRSSHRGPVWIAAELGLVAGTVGRVLRRHQMPALAAVDPITGPAVRRRHSNVRYEHPYPGDLLHVDVKKLGRIPDGGGWRLLGRDATAAHRHKRIPLGYDYLRVAVDDRTRLAYIEVHTDEKDATSAEFLHNAAGWFRRRGVTVRRILTDNALVYRRGTQWSAVCATLQLRRRFIRPGWPWTNGKAERLNRTLLTEWAYAKPWTSNADRVASLDSWVDHYNNRRGHSALGGQPRVSPPGGGGRRAVSRAGACRSGTVRGHRGRFCENRPKRSQKRTTAMTHDQSALLDLLAELNTADEVSVMRRILASGLQALIEAEATVVIGAGRHERTPARTTQRNGSRPKTVTTTAGDINVAIPKTRTGSFFPSLLEPRRRIDRALHAVICEAYVHGVSTRKVDDLVTAMGGLSGVSKSEVSRICGQLDEEVGAFANRPLDETGYPYLFVDATYCKVRTGGRVVSQAVVVATGVTADGRREVLVHAVGDSETEAFWTIPA